MKKERRNPNDPARFIGKVAVTEDGETAKIYNYLDTEKIEQEALYDGMYAVTTDLLDDDAKDILKVSEGRWEIEECFRIMKTDFETRPVFLRDDIRIHKSPFPYLFPCISDISLPRKRPEKCLQLRNDLG